MISKSSRTIKIIGLELEIEKLYRKRSEKKVVRDRDLLNNEIIIAQMEYRALTENFYHPKGL